ncbi:uncharacterized protein LOC126316999 [Schistocerca gregaria]|uniref:uncharacterized protein LOC126316999 n=1 Tax=Schistocerca gregaria TaxID=7010 RepID=UPI00211E477D|nr:uncharacterized protein LOC126316999 [Schistocerca gregaria]
MRGEQLVSEGAGTSEMGHLMTGEHREPAAKERMVSWFDFGRQKVMVFGLRRGEGADCLSALVTFYGGEWVYLKGIASIRVAFGRVECFGYKMSSSNAGPYRVVSPSFYGAHAVSTLDEGECVKGLSGAEECSWAFADIELGFDKFVERFFLTDLAGEFPDPAQIAAMVVVDSVPVEAMYANVPSIMSHSLRKMGPAPHSLRIGSYDILKSDAFENILLQAPEEWKEWKRRLHRVEGDRILLCGRKSSGKSTMLRYTINSLLNLYGAVALLDCNTEEPELTLPGQVSLTVLTRPLLGPAFSNFHESGITYQKSHFLSTKSTTDCPDRYMQAVIELCHVYEAGLDAAFFERSSSSNMPKRIPLVANSMGCVLGFDERILRDLARQLSPNTVIQMNQEVFGKEEHNVAANEDPARGKLRPSNCEPQVKTFGLSFDQSAPIDFSAEKWNMSVNSYFCFDKNSVNRYGQTTYRVSWQAVRIHVMSHRVPPSQYLYALNGSIVALVADSRTYVPLERRDNLECGRDNDSYESTPEEKKKNASVRHLSTDSSEFPVFLLDSPRPADSECLGMGLLKTIDMTQRYFYVQAPLSLDRIQKVNTLVLGNLKLPSRFLLENSNDEQPYLSEDYMPRYCGSMELK